MIDIDKMTHKIMEIHHELLEKDRRKTLYYIEENINHYNKERCSDVVAVLNDIHYNLKKSWSLV